ncbi:lectin-like domain-containing protein [Lactococcus insecticola]|uniref:MucBP domain-containing protein n=1 Tax=Pseudolactococcus insecticola TaxID=2709158 RepID=A0A6A0B730_9LACT|nr:MucBP domain-containing protein [Lactococcus insecticola]GFH40756.1 hypothetical protein Hs20B_11540 [Lactococcus insecticola]
MKNRQYQLLKRARLERRRTHFRTWKSGKNWVYASSVIAALAGGPMVLARDFVRADEIEKVVPMPHYETNQADKSDETNTPTQNTSDSQIAPVTPPEIMPPSDTVPEKEQAVVTHEQTQMTDTPTAAELPAVLLAFTQTIQLMMPDGSNQTLSQTADEGTAFATVDLSKYARAGYVMTVNGQAVSQIAASTATSDELITVDFEKSKVETLSDDTIATNPAENSQISDTSEVTAQQDSLAKQTAPATTSAPLPETQKIVETPTPEIVSIYTTEWAAQTQGAAQDYKDSIDEILDQSNAVADADDGDSIVRNAAILALQVHQTQELSAIKQNIATLKSGSLTTAQANNFVSLTDQILSDMAQEIALAEKMLLEDNIGFVTEKVTAAQEAYQKLILPANTTASLSSYGDLIINAANSTDYNTALTAISAQGLTSAFRNIVDPAVASTIDTVTDAENGNHSLTVGQTQVTANFTTSGSASNATGSYGGQSATFTTLTPGTSTSQSGSIAFNQQIDMTNNWTLKFDIDLTKLNTGGTGGVLSAQAAQGAGDFVGLILSPVLPSQLSTGATGGGLGIQGLANTYSWGIDFWNNGATNGDSSLGVNPTGGSTGLLGGSNGSNGNQVVGFRHTDASGNLVAANQTTDQQQAITSIQNWPGGTQGTDVTATVGTTTATWTSSTNPQINTPAVASYAYNGDGTGTLTVTFSGSTYTQTFTLPTTVMSVGLGAADGSMYSQMGVTITDFELTLATGTTTVNYVDQNGNVIKTATTIVANAGDTLGITNVSPNYATDSYSYTAPTITGYTIKSANDVTVVSDLTGTNTMTIVYQADPQTVQVVFVVDNGTIAPPAMVTQTGVTGGTYSLNVTSSLPAGYHFVNPSYNSTFTGTYDNDDSTNQQYTAEITADVQTLNISYTFPSGHDLSSSLTTAQKTQNSITTVDFAAVSIPQITGYTSYYTVGGVTTAGTSIPALATDTTSNGTSSVDSTPQSVSVTYTANPRQITVDYPADTTSPAVDYPSDVTITQNSSGVGYVTDGSYDAIAVGQVTGYVSYVDLNDGNGFVAMTTIPAGKFAATDITFNVTYQSLQATVYYYIQQVDSSGNPISSPQQLLSQSEGSGYNFDAFGETTTDITASLLSVNFLSAGYHVVNAFWDNDGDGNSNNGALPKSTWTFAQTTNIGTDDNPNFVASEVYQYTADAQTALVTTTYTDASTSDSTATYSGYTAGLQVVNVPAVNGYVATVTDSSGATYNITGNQFTFTYDATTNGTSETDGQVQTFTISYAPRISGVLINYGYASDTTTNVASSTSTDTTAFTAPTLSSSVQLAEAYGDDYTVDVPDVLGYTWTVTDNNGNSYTSDTLPTSFVSDGTDTTYSVTYAPDTSTITIEYYLETIDAAGNITFTQTAGPGLSASVNTGTIGTVLSYDPSSVTMPAGYTFDRLTATSAVTGDNDNLNGATMAKRLTYQISDTTYIVYLAADAQSVQVKFMSDPQNTATVYIDGRTGDTYSYDTSGLARPGYTYVITDPTGATVTAISGTYDATSNNNGTAALDNVGEGDLVPQVYTVTYTADFQQAVLVDSNGNTTLETVNGTTAGNLTFTTTDSGLARAGYTYTVTGPDGMSYATLAAALSGEVFDNTDNPAGSTTDASVQTFTITYKASAQTATIVTDSTDPNGAQTVASTAGVTGGAITFDGTTDSTLARAGYSYTVSVTGDTTAYATLAAALAANNTFDATNNGTSLTDASPQLFTVSYTANAQTVTVNYVYKQINAQGKTGNVATAITLTGQTNDPSQVTTAVTAPAGYTVQVSNTQVVNWTVGSDGNLVTTSYTFYYAPNADTATIIYQDAAGNSLASYLPAGTNLTPQGYTDGTIATPGAITIAGYTYQSVSGATVYSGANDVLTYIYAANAQSVTVHYVMENGSGTVTGAVSADTTVTGQTNDAATTITAVAAPAGYTLQGSQTQSVSWAVNADGTLVTSDYTFIYTANAQSATIIYQDSNGNNLSSLLPANTILSANGYTDDTITTSGVVTIAGYTYTSVTGPSTYADGTNTIIYIYTANAQTATIHYVYQTSADNTTYPNGSDVSAPTTLTSTTNATAGTANAIAAPTGFVLVGSQTQTVNWTINADGTLTKTDYYFYYAPETNTAAIKYLDENNNDISGLVATGEKPIITGPVGDTGTVIETSGAVTIPGYTFNDVSTSLSEDSGGNYLYSGTGTPANPDTIIYYYTANTQTVTVHYIYQGGSKDGTDVATAITVSATSNATETTTESGVTAPAGYTLVTGTQTISWAINSDGNLNVTDYYFYYTPNADTATISYQDSDGNDLSAYLPSGTLLSASGVTDDTITTSGTVAIAGYTYTSVSGPTTFTAGTDLVTYVYTANAQTITINYVYQQVSGQGKTGNVTTATTLNGVTNQSGSTQNAVTAPAGYTISGATSYTVTWTVNADGTLITPSYTFYYIPVAQTATIAYQDSNGNDISPLAPSGTLTSSQGYTDGSITTSGAVTIAGYSYTAASSTNVASPVFTAGTNTVIYVYTANPGTVTYYYLDQDGNTIAAPVQSTKNDSTGDSYATGVVIAEDNFAIAGYTYFGKGTTSDSDMLVDASGSSSVTYIYTALIQTVNVSFVDSNGQTLADTITLTGNSNAVIDYTSLTTVFAGYTLSSDGRQTTTNYDATAYTTTDTAPQNVVLIYTADQQTININYVVSGSNATLQPSQAVTGVSNGSFDYTTYAQAISGYTLMPAASTTVSSFDTDDATDQTVTLVYQADPQQVILNYVSDPENTASQTYNGVTDQAITEVVTLTDADLARAGYSYTIMGSDGKVYATLAAALSGIKTCDNTDNPIAQTQSMQLSNPRLRDVVTTTDTDAAAQVITVTYTADTQSAVVTTTNDPSGDKTYTAVTGASDSDITSLGVTDTDLARAGYTYTVTGPDGATSYATLAAALAANPTFDTDDATNQVFTVVYTAQMQVAQIITTNDPVTTNSATVETENGPSDSNIAFETTDTDLARAGYTYTVTGPDNEVYESLSAALAANPSYDDSDVTNGTDPSPQVFTVTYTANTDTPYTVEYLDDATSTDLKATLDLTGTTDTAIVNDATFISGYTLTNTTGATTINGDGSTAVVNHYTALTVPSEGDVDNETAVQTALATYTAATNETDQAAALTALSQAISAAETARDAANTDASTALASVTPDIATTVASLVTTLQNLVTAAADPSNPDHASATTAAIAAATAALKTAVANANTAKDDAVDDANAVVTSPYAMEADVESAQNALDTLLADPDATAAAITTATQALEDAVNAAQAPRTAALAAATSAENSITDDVSAIPAVVAAQNALDAAVAAANGNTGTTQDVIDATTALTNAITTATNAKSDAVATAEAVVTSPVDNESAVITAQNALNTLLADDSATADAITQATTALQNAVDTANTTRDTANANASAADSAITSAIATDPAVAAAQNTLDDLVAAAADPTNPNHASATSDAINQAAQALQDAVATAQRADAVSAAGQIVTAPYAAEPSVIAAQQALDAAISDSTSSAATIESATAALAQAVSDATGPRNTANSSATTAENAITPSIAVDSAVSAAKAALDAAVSAAAGNTATTAQINAAVTALNNAVAAANNALADAKTSAQTDLDNVPENVSDDSAVTAAKSALSKVLADQTSTLAEVQNAQTALDTAVSTAQTALSDAKTTAQTDLNSVPVNVSDDSVVTQAEQALQNVLTNPNSTKTDIDNAQTALDNAVSTAQTALADAKTSAQTDLTSVPANVSDDSAVTQAEQALQDVLTNPDSTKTDVETAQTALDNAVSTAQTALADAKTSAQTDLTNVPANVGDNSAVTQAEQALQAVLNNPDSTKTDIDNAQSALDNAVSAAQTALSDEKTSAQADLNSVPVNVSDESAVTQAEQALQDILNNPDSTKTDIETAQTALDNAVSTAQTALASAKTSAQTDLNSVPVNVSDESAVTQAEQALQDILNNPDSTKTDIQTAQSALDSAVTQAQDRLANLKQTVIVNFVDQNGNVIASSVTLTGQANSTIDYTPTNANAVIAGYTLVSDGRMSTTTYDATAYTGDTDTSPQTVTLVYKADAQKIVISFVTTDADGNTTTIQTSQTVTGVTAEDFNYQDYAPYIQGYTLMVGQCQIVDAFDSNDNNVQNVILVYQADPQQVIFEYVADPLNTDPAIYNGATDRPLSSSVELTDADLVRAGYSYTVRASNGKVYATLAEALAAVLNFDNTDNPIAQVSRLAMFLRAVVTTPTSLDKAAQTFVITYTPNTQTAQVKAVNDPAGTTSYTAVTGDSTSQITTLGVTDATLKRAGYTYVVSAPDGKWYSNLAAALAANDVFDTDDAVNQVFTVIYAAEVTQNISDDQTVIESDQALQETLADPNADVTAIETASDELTSAVEAAEKALSDTRESAQTALDSVPENVSDNTQVAAAEASLEDEITDPDSTKTAIETAQSALDNAVTQAESALTDAKMTAQTDLTNVPANVSDDSAVTQAEQALQAVLNNPDSTKTAIETAQSALDNAVSAAQTALADAKTAAQTDLTNVPVNVRDNSAVTQAEQVLQDILNNPDSTKTDIETAQSALDNAVSTAKIALADAKTSAQTDLTNVPANVGDNSAVTQAEQALQAVLTDPDSTKTAIETAQSALNSAVKAAELALADPAPIPTPAPQAPKSPQEKETNSAIEPVAQSTPLVAKVVTAAPVPQEDQTPLPKNGESTSKVGLFSGFGILSVWSLLEQKRHRKAKKSKR